MTVARTVATPSALRLSGVEKRYGKRAALSGLNLTVPRGSICALVGPNGAGKTTTLAIVAGFLQADAGTVDVLGDGPFVPELHRGRVGILPQDAELPPASTPRQLLRVWGRIQGLDRKAAETAVEAALDNVDLRERGDTRVATLSHGMKRRLTVASALLGDPELVLLDEPTSGLDPAQALQLRDRIARERGRRTVLFSSHNLLELEALCDHVIFIEGGRCSREGPMMAMTGKDREAYIRIEAPFPEGLGEWVALRLSAGDPRTLGQALTQRLGELLRAGATIGEVRRGESLERRFFADASEGT